MNIKTILAITLLILGVWSCDFFFGKKKEAEKTEQQSEATKEDAAKSEEKKDDASASEEKKDDAVKSE